MSKVKVMAGPCGFNTSIEAVSEGRKVKLKITSECPHYKALEAELTQADPYSEVLAPFGESKIFEVCKRYAKHATCPVPLGILKAVEIEGKLALAVSPIIETEK